MTGITANGCMGATALSVLLAACAATPPPAAEGEEMLSVRAWAAPDYPGARGGPEMRGVRCTMSNDKGSWVAITPAKVPVLTSRAPLEIECTADGYKPMNASFRCRTLREIQRSRAAGVLLLPFALITAPSGIASVMVGLSGQATPAQDEPPWQFEAGPPCSYGNIAVSLSRP